MVEGQLTKGQIVYKVDKVIGLPVMLRVMHDHSAGTEYINVGIKLTSKYPDDRIHRHNLYPDYLTAEKSMEKQLSECAWPERLTPNRK